MNSLCPKHLVAKPDELLSNELHMMPNDGLLDLHLDCDVHPRTKHRRAVNAILFLNDGWNPDWLGQLEFWDPIDGLIAAITPAFNRLVVFETNEFSYHGVPRPMRAPEGVWRKSMAVYWWLPPDGKEPKRPRAQFVALPGEPIDEEKARWRQQRSGK